MSSAADRAAACRVLLAALGLCQGALSCRQAVPHDPISHELCATGVALAVTTIHIAWRPARARGLLPLFTVLGIGLATLGLVDLARGETPVIAEWPHLLVIVEAGTLWTLARFDLRQLRTPIEPAREHLDVDFDFDKSVYARRQDAA